MKKIRSKMNVLVFTSLYTDFFRRSRAGNSVFSGRIWLKLELIQAYMHVLISCKNEEDPIKTDGARVFTTCLPLEVYGEFFRHSRAAYFAAHGPIRLNFNISPDLMVVLVTCKNEGDSIKIEEARVFTKLYIDF